MHTCMHHALINYFMIHKLLDDSVDFRDRLLFVIRVIHNNYIISMFMRRNVAEIW